MRVPAGGLQPQAAVDHSGRLHLLYYTGDPGTGDLDYVRRDAGSDSFSKPLRVNTEPGTAVAIGTIRGGQLALGRDGRPLVLWNGSSKALPRGPGKYDAPLLFSRLDDAGQAFEAQRDVIGSAYVLDGGSSIAADGQGHVAIVWHAGTESERVRRVWIRRSDDDGAHFAPETAVDEPRQGVCGCCGLKAFADGEGTVHVLYRTAESSADRNMQLLSGKITGEEFSGRLLEKWKIPNCPMSSATFAGDKSGTWGAWETSGQVTFASLDREAQTRGPFFTPPGSPGNRKHPALALGSNGQILLSWVEGTGWEKGGSLHWQEFDRDGKPTRVRGRKDGVPVWSFAAAVAVPGGGYEIFY